MRKLRIDLSNKLTNYGVELLYRKIFDADTEYDHVFFTDLETARKLHLYYDGGYIESDREEVSIAPDYLYLQIKYYYDSVFTQKVTRLVLEDDIGKILDLENQYISQDDSENSNSQVTCIVCRFVLNRNTNKAVSTADGYDSKRWVPVVLTDEGVKFIYESLANLRNEKVNFIYTGNGTPNNSPENCHIVHLLDDIQLGGVRYFDRYCLLIGRKPFPYNLTVLNEVGIGFYLKHHPYIKNYLATMDRDWEDKMYPIDWKSSDNPNALEYDHPVLSLRIDDSDYLCVWYSGKEGDEDETNFPNLSFTATFYVSITYTMYYDEEKLSWAEDFSQDLEL